MQRETKKFLRLALLWYLFFCSGLKPNLQYLWGVPVLGFIFALLPCFLCVCVFFVALSLLIAFFCIELISSHLKVKVKLLSHVRLFATQWTVAYQAPPSMGFSRQECWSKVGSKCFWQVLGWKILCKCFHYIFLWGVTGSFGVPGPTALTT